MHDQKMQDMKMAEQMAGHENAGPENERDGSCSIIAFEFYYSLPCCY